jgi:uncharacterized spore protein YtfJ
VRVHDLDRVLADVRDAVSVRRVFGEPYEKGGVTVIPAAKVWGGGGGGFQDGGARRGPSAGVGGGFGIAARPAGVVVIRGETVRWQPAVDPTLVVLAVLALLVVLRRLRRRRRWRRFARERLTAPAGGPVRAGSGVEVDGDRVRDRQALAGEDVAGRDLPGL